MLPGLGLLPQAEQKRNKPRFIIREFPWGLHLPPNALGADVKYNPLAAQIDGTLHWSLFGDRAMPFADLTKLAKRILAVFVDARAEEKQADNFDLAVFGVHSVVPDATDRAAFEFCARITELAIAVRFASGSDARKLARHLLAYAMKHEYPRYRHCMMSDVFCASALPEAPDLFVLDDIEEFSDDAALVRLAETKPVWFGGKLLAVDMIRKRSPKIDYRYIGGLSGHGDAEKYNHIFDKSKEGRSVVLPEREQVIRDWLVRMGAGPKPLSSSGSGAGAAPAPKRRKTEELKTETEGQKPFRVAVSTAMLGNKWTTDIVYEEPSDDDRKAMQKAVQSATSAMFSETETLHVALEEFPLITHRDLPDSPEEAGAIKRVLQPGWTDAIVVFVPRLAPLLPPAWRTRLAALGYLYWVAATPPEQRTEMALDAAAEVAKDAFRPEVDGIPYLPLEMLMAIRCKPSFADVLKELDTRVTAADVDEEGLPEYNQYRAAVDPAADLPPILFVALTDNVNLVLKEDLKEYVEARWGKKRVESRARALAVTLQQHNSPEAENALGAGLREIPPDVLKMIAAMSLSGHCEICERNGDDGVVKCAKCGQEVCKDLCYATHVKRNHAS